MTSYFFLILFALLPSFVWLCFFLRKDARPESNSMILKVFFWGMVAALLVIAVEIGFFGLFENLKMPILLVLAFHSFIGVAFFEEFSKYLVVRFRVLRDPEFDEPVDAMLYMIIAALGFAALENFLYLLPGIYYPLEQIVFVAGFRFISATFLHALCSGLMGYFLALSFFKIKKRTQLLFWGLFLATLLHGFYNFSIMVLRGWDQLIFPILLLLILAILVFGFFKKLKKLKSICK